MIFTETSLPGVYLIAIEKREDGRGFFARAWCTQEFAGRGLVSQMVQCNLSSNKRRGTLRSLHYQIAPYQETKLVRCIKGAIFDVIVDVRPDSPTYGRWLGVELTAEHYTMLYVPQHCAHGFLTLQDNTEVMYQVSQFYAPECERGVRYDDPAFGITWPLAVEVLLEAGVVLTNADGDQPGVLMNLYRFGQGIGVEPVLCGNIKGLHDPYRNPTTQAAFARQLQQNPRMVTSFADGTKISFEQAIVANATGMRVAKRGMYGPSVPPGTPIQEAGQWFPVEELLSGPGLVDYVVGAAPSPGVFVLGTHPHPQQQHYLNLYKPGRGPLYCFYTPYHLCHFEVPNSVARAALFGDATIAPRGGLCVEVVATAKIPLQAGTVLDGIGEYMTYGQCENADAAQAQRLLPMGMAQGCRLKRDLGRDEVLTYADVELPKGRLSDRLRAKQDQYFGSPHPLARRHT